MRRRTLLRGVGASALAMPLVSGLARRSAAHADAPPLRFFLMFTGNGQLPEHWLPTGGETDFTLSPVLEPLLPLRDKLLLVHGMHGVGGHAGGMSETTTGRPSGADGSGVPTGGPSIDQFFADRWRGQTPLPSLELGVMPAMDAYDQICYSDSGLPIPPIGSALGAFERVFSVTNEDPATAEQRRARERSILDVIATDLERIQAGLGASSRTLLDEHLELVREREQELLGPYEPVSCELPAMPGGGLGLADTWRSHNDTLVAALRCGVTRVATLRVGGWGGIESGGYDEIGIPGAHHAAAHGGTDDPGGTLSSINRWHAEQLAYLLTALDAVDEANGTLLDNTVVVWVNELGLGPFNHHSRVDVHVVLAGGKNAGLAQGRFRNLGDADYQNFLLSLTHLLGETDVTTFGDHGTTVLDGLFA
jgi:hypothetical protein